MNIYTLFLAFLEFYLYYYRPNFEPFSANSSLLEISEQVKGAARQNPSAKEDIVPSDQVQIGFIGCYSSEKYFVDKVYSGGIVGAALNPALKHAETEGKSYAAIARAGEQSGHSFAFSRLSKKASVGGDRPPEECQLPCIDESEHPCGCADAACDPSIKKAKEEENLRRWAVYEIRLPSIRKMP